MTTVKYSENVNIISGLQAGTRDHKAQETEIAKELVFDIMCNAIRQLASKERQVSDLQGYYYPTIYRKAAFHGAFIKSFQWFKSFDLVITGSFDHQYPLQIFITFRGLLVKCLYTFKSSSKALTNELLPNTDKLASYILNQLNNIDVIEIAHRINRLDPELSEFSSHFRYFRKECANLMESLGI